MREKRKNGKINIWRTNRLQEFFLGVLRKNLLSSEVS